MGTKLEIGLREKKAAQTRLAIAEALGARLAFADFDAISAEDLAADANVSRMTFFNYFPNKLDVVDLLVTIYEFQFAVSVQQHGLRGVAAIEHLFEQVGREVAESPDRIRRVFALCAARPRSSAELSPADRLLLGGDSEVDFRGLGSTFMRLVQEAREDGHELVGSNYEISHLLGALMHGSALVGLSSPETDWLQLYRRHVRRALGLLGAEGWSDPRPPRVPKKYKTQSATGRASKRVPKGRRKRRKPASVGSGGR